MRRIIIRRRRGIFWKGGTRKEREEREGGRALYCCHTTCLKEPLPWASLVIPFNP